MCTDNPVKRSPELKQGIKHRQHNIIREFKTWAAGPAGVKTCDLHLNSPKPCELGERASKEV